jgi:response regulator of citrate/malate metabolism
VNVLVVEDEALVAILMQELVEDAGHACIGPVASVEEARALIESQHVDAALLDIWLRNDEFVWHRAGVGEPTSAVRVRVGSRSGRG